MSSASTGRTQPQHNGHRHAGAGAVRPMVLAAAKLLFIPLASAAPTPLKLVARHLHILEDGEDLPKDADDPSLWIYLGVAIALVLLGGVFAGLTIALMGQDETYLHVIATSGEGSEKRHASKVLNLLKKGKHWVLVTLLLSNVITNETLPIVLDRSLGGGWPAVVSSTVLIVIFGEVVPQSICVRYGLSIGAYCAPLVVVLMWIMCPVAWPTAKLLDHLLGEDHGTMYKKAGLKTLVTLHKTLGAGAGERLMEDEVTIINSVLDLKDKPVGDIMTPMQDVFTMSADTVLDERMMDTILSQGYSRIPIYAPDNNRNFIGMLLVKILITYDPEDCKRVRDFALATLPETAPHTSCLDIINFFQEGKSHMVLVSDFPGQDRGALGVLTLEDVIEELIGEEIIDESDVFIDVHKAIRRMAPAPKTRFPSRTRSVVEEDDGKEADENEPLIKKDTTESRKTSLANGQTTFFMRRRSSAASDSTRERSVPVRKNTAEIREHLKHLGPSNAASKPKPTKFTSVKIKPGVGTIPENHQTTTGIDSGSGDARPGTAPNQATVDEAVEALRSGSRGASSGAAAVYGTMDTPPTRPRGMSGSEQMSAQEASRIARENTSVPPENRIPQEDGSSQNQESQQQQEERTQDQKLQEESKPTNETNTNSPSPLKLTPELPEKLVVGGSAAAEDDNDQLGDMQSSYSGKKRMTARSGSITESTIEVGGMKKVVLETTSSSEDGHEETRSHSHRTLNSPGSKNEEHDEKDSGSGGHESNGESSGKKKRKKRGKKKKGGD
ncbi:uncharacterized protein MYCFIDRAFT_201799 [Pseudocercospora fijiensis CIRAD86]|uniref:CNNM transmembrane domain-containing protein n=1 Tax=Pseudocercospora fijiensis (strain CIRAD86) TaxID=383855 RepID=N1QCH3_PSEFD|nr:uncharacterized protein MYCFIDRAFT_201799 [Pseudocercospora fijiensis CIRAD86]EME89133.1 hypothetical protein MYCFIDRAFT_201799 [Pseudocercospora fijiensis CIRAD86]